MKDLGVGHIKLRGFMDDSGFNFSRYYQPGRGIEPLMEAISSFENTPTETILVTSGGSLALVYSLCLLPKNSTVLCPSPYYPAYPAIIRNLGLNIQYYHLREENQWQIVADEILASNITSLSAILLNTPGNPTGNMCSQGELSTIIAFAKTNGIKIISDEVYAPIVYTENCISCLPEVSAENVIVIKSFSKIFMLPGERVGYIIAAPALINALSKIQWSLAMTAPAYGQYRCVQLLRENTDLLISSMVNELRENRSLANDMLACAKNVVYQPPAAGIFYWIKLVKSKADLAVFHDQLARKEIIIMPGELFGEEFYNYLRINFAIPKQDLKEAMQEILLSL